MSPALLAPIALAGIAGVQPGDLESVYAPRRVALVIGVDAYEDPALPGLRFAAKDARELAAALRDPAAGGYDQVTLLTDPERTDRASLQAAIQHATANLQRDDTFLLYLSGHGSLELDPLEGTTLYVLPSDGQLDDPRRTALPVRWLEELVSELPARRRVLVLDTCHNGRDKSSLPPRTASLLQGMRGDPPPPREGRAIGESEARLYAAQYHQAAMEDPALGNGVYTHFLLRALTDERDAADLDGDGLVDVIEAHSYARDGTMQHTGGRQVPRAEYRIVGREEIYLSGDPSQRQEAEWALISATAALLDRARLFVDGVPRGALPGTYAIDPGAHAIEVRTGDGRLLTRRQLSTRAGSHYAIEDLIPPTRRALWLLTGAELWTGDRITGVALGSLELGVEPLRWRFFAPALNLRGSLGRGQPGDLSVAATGGLGTVGLLLGLAPAPALRIGPTVEAGLAWRALAESPGAAAQAQPVWLPGLRAQATLPLGDASGLAVRYDVRRLAWSIENGRSAAWVHGAAIGLQMR